MKKPKPKKPLECGWAYISGLDDRAIVYGCALRAQDARRLAAWLIRFAEWAEAKEPK